MRKRRFVPFGSSSSSSSSSSKKPRLLSKPFKPPRAALGSRATPAASATATPAATATTTATATAEDGAAAKKVVVSRKRKPTKFGKPFKPPTQAKGVPRGGRAASLATRKGGKPVVTRYYAVVWRKASRKKHKSWEGDGVLKAEGAMLTLFNDAGKKIAKSRLQGGAYVMTEGEELFFSSKEVEIMGPVSEEDFLSGKAFMATAAAVPPSTALFRSRVKSAAKATAVRADPDFEQGGSESGAAAPSRSSGVGRSSALYSPDTPGAFVLHRATDPSRELSVVLSPKLTKILRPHQKEGVAFMYKCVMGHGDFVGEGCILADEMGLGKTITALALVNTLLSQTEVRGTRAAAEKAVVVTPTSLVRGWESEIRKWLGFTHLPPVTIYNMSKSEIKAAVAEFVTGRVKNLLIISYEQFRIHAKAICSARVGLLVCDEGHRLKNAEIKTAKALLKLSTKRRVILTGTPVQNNLKEFFSVVDFINPGVLGEYAAFKRIFEEPIAKAQERNASPAVVALGKARSDELNRITSQFILRRTQAMMRKYLPPKEEHVLFIKMNPLQEALYAAVARSKMASVSGSDNSFSWALSCITTLKKLCNHPALVLGRSTKNVQAAEDDPDDPVCLDDLDLPPDLLRAVSQYPDLMATLGPVDPTLSSKTHVLMALLDHLAASTQDKLVLVSNYTQTLSLIAEMLDAAGHKYLRLDGSVPASKRPVLVNRFNRGPETEAIFLLSAKAGGVGLNLIGANRLIMLDPDWNPATDLQAMGRVWRDGQKKRVILYRFLTTGTIEEKIWQRQIMKQGLSDVIVDDNGSNAGSFTKSELRNLFRYNPTTLAETHELLECQCPADGSPIPGMSLNAAAVEAAQKAAADAAADSALDSALDALDAPLDPLDSGSASESAAEPAEAPAAAAGDTESESLVWSHVEWPAAVGDFVVKDLASTIDEDGVRIDPSASSDPPRPLVSFSFSSSLASQRAE